MKSVDFLKHLGIILILNLWFCMNHFKWHCSKQNGLILLQGNYLSVARKLERRGNNMTEHQREVVSESENEV